MNELLVFLPKLALVGLSVCGIFCALLGYCCLIVGARADEARERAFLRWRLEQVCGDVARLSEADGQPNA